MRELAELLDALIEHRLGMLLPRQGWACIRGDGSSDHGYYRPDPKIEYDFVRAEILARFDLGPVPGEPDQIAHRIIFDYADKDTSRWIRYTGYDDDATPPASSDEPGSSNH